MTFEKFLEGTKLPSTAKEQLPSILSESMKKKLLKNPDAEIILSSVIDEINHGSIEPVELLLMKRLK